jgi:hypothetical protein
MLAFLGASKSLLQHMGAHCTDEPGRDADQLHQSRRDVHWRPEPGCGVRVELILPVAQPLRAVRAMADQGQSDDRSAQVDRHS